MRPAERTHCAPAERAVRSPAPCDGSRSFDCKATGVLLVFPARSWPPTHASGKRSRFHAEDMLGIDRLNLTELRPRNGATSLPCCGG